MNVDAVAGRPIDVYLGQPMHEAQRSSAARRAVRRRSQYLFEAFRPPGFRSGRAVLLPDRRTSRLVDSPVFVISSQRSGSTLLRVLLNSHSRIRAPHELHLDSLQVQLSADYAGDVMGELGFGRTNLEHLLWDRVLDHELSRSGKDIIVDKTPSNALIWRRVAAAWPNARYLFLLRHPGSVLESVLSRHHDAEPESAVREISDYVTGVQEARENLSGLTLKYEDLTASPERETQRISEYLGVSWEPDMLEYGRKDHGPFKPYFGDWSTNIGSGRVQPARPLPSAADIPEPLRKAARIWGYTDC